VDEEAEGLKSGGEGKGSGFGLGGRKWRRKQKRWREGCQRRIL
jgi:hypothetical protein